MNPNNISFLESHRHVYSEVINAKTCKKANDVRGDLIRILREEFIPGYVVMDGCTSCLFQVTRLLFERYDNWKAGQGEANALENKTMEEAIAEPVADAIAEPVTVAASFPKNDKKRKR